MQLKYYIFISLFLFAFAVGYFVNKFVLKTSIIYNLRKSNITADRWENQSKPIFGGISFYVIFLLIFLYYIFSFGISSLSENHLLAYLLVITLSFFMGLADDLLNTSPYFKFGVQLINATILIFFGIYIDISSSQVFNYIVTYFWVIGIMNSVNMLDNMDSISTLITITILIGAFISIIFGNTQVSEFSIFVVIGTIGVLLSFLTFFNWNPSSMYMGDNGSQFIGSLLAIVGILVFWNSSGKPSGFITIKPIYVTVMVFLIPMVDTTTVTINRLVKGKSPFVGGKDHITHHLFYAGLTDKKVVLLLALISVISIAFAIYLMNSKTFFSNIQIFMFSIFIIAVFISLYATTKITKPKPEQAKTKLDMKI